MTLKEAIILCWLITKKYQICYIEKRSKPFWAIFWLWKQKFFEILKIYCRKLFPSVLLLSLLWTQLCQLKWPTVSNSFSIATLVNLTFISVLIYFFQYGNGSLETFKNSLSGCFMRRMGKEGGGFHFTLHVRWVPLLKPSFA